MINNKTQEEVLDYFYRLRLVFTLWRFVVKASVIKDNNLMLVEGIIHEDEEWCVRMLLECKTFKKLQQPIEAVTSITNRNSLVSLVPASLIT